MTMNAKIDRQPHLSRAEWVSMLLLELLRDAVYLPGSK